MKQNNEYKVGLYCRLSCEDKDRSGDSESIINQRIALEQYAAAHDFSVRQIYIDDGVSGTIFDRQGLNDLKRDIKNGLIDCVLCKDLSRLGRDNVKTGQLRRLFQLAGVRLIAVNDNLDSINSDSNMEFIADMKDILNRQYAVDISNKITGSFKAKMKAGLYIGAVPPYGYKRDDKDHNKLIIDGVVCANVKRIFRLACEGMKPSEIAKVLNDDGIIPPNKYKGMAAWAAQIWTKTTVQKMIKNRVYTGCLVQGRTSTRLRQQTKYNTPDKWIVVEGTHEPIVDKSIFNEANRLMRQRCGIRSTGFVNMFKGVAFCADCGQRMATTGTRRKEQPYDLVCMQYKQYGVKGCKTHRIGYKILCDIVLDAIRQQLQLSQEDKEDIIKELESSTMIIRQKRDLQKDLQKKELQIKTQIKAVYIDYSAGKLSDDMKGELLDTFNKQLESLHKALLDYEKEKEKEEELLSRKKQYQELLQQFTDINELTAEILDTFIERIEVCEGDYDNRTKIKKQDINIVFRFSNVPTVYCCEL